MANDHIEKVDEILENARGNPLDIYAVLYREYLLSSEKPSAVLQHILQFCAHPVGSEDDDSPELMSNEQEWKIKRNYYRLAREIVWVLARENLPVEEFYEKLYVQIFSSELFPDDESIKIVLLKLLAEELSILPYFQASNLLPMTNENYQAALERVNGQVIQALHMLNRNFDSRTEEASQLCRLAAELPDKEDQTVYWAVLVSILKDGAKQLEDPVG